MTARRQLAVASPISPASLARALLAAGAHPRTLAENARARVASIYGAPGVTLTDSGTSALILALRLAVPNGGVVAYPGYACVDLAAAARFAGVNVRLYDLDPTTLGPDLDSVAHVLERGVDALVVAHLFGYPADVAGVRALAAPAGVTVIEDAAQGSGGMLNGARLGALGDLSVLSFGRGKGLSAAGGGAVLGRTDEWVDPVRRISTATGGRGFGAVANAAVQWMFGRPTLYAIPSALPWLHLGEMVYHAAHEPRGIAAASTALIETAYALEEREVLHRRGVAEALDSVAVSVPDIAPTKVIPGAVGGYLRYAARDLAARRTISPELGIVQPYPRALCEQPELQPALLAGEHETPGSIGLRKTLFALPTHGMVARRDIRRLDAWLRGDGVNRK
jgi:hypothetical protein